MGYRRSCWSSEAGQLAFGTDGAVSEARPEPSEEGAAVSDKRREELGLRTIVVSGRGALKKPLTDEERERLRDRIHQLLADLEDTVIRDGADQELLDGIDRKRRQLWE